MRNNLNFILLILALVANISLASEDGSQKFWPHWRGPLATGAVLKGNPPVEWSESKNVKWKTAIDGLGLSTPIIWENSLYITTAIGPAKNEGEGWQRANKPVHALKFTLIALDRNTGKILWQKTATEHLPHEGTPANGIWAANSHITDGQFCDAYFGSNGLFCYDFSGKLIWQKEMEKIHTRRDFGEGSSPALYGKYIVLTRDNEDQSFIEALDKNTGKRLWRVNRDVATSWATPLIVEVDGKPQVIINATGATRAYDLKTGKEIWFAEGMTRNTIPSPVQAGGTVFVTSGYRGADLQAIRLSGAKGDLSNSSAILWRYQKDTPYVPSPLLCGDYIYVLKGNRAVLTCLDAASGQVFYAAQKLEGIRDIYASPVGTKDKVYLLGREGTTKVIALSDKYQELATNKLADNFDASPAIVGDEIYLRGRHYIYCISAQ